ncbi:MAG TPA: RHS repeat-associated core domain-containing protein, partial [Gemmataceae bacterium]|nr:RHS repeat-associated core domain-containing protein [Gemmataceae bacterium]
MACSVELGIMKKSSWWQKFPRLHQWLRLGRVWDTLLGFWEEQAANARRKLARAYRLLRKPRAAARRKSYALALEGLETRMVPSISDALSASVRVNDPEQGTYAPFGPALVAPATGEVLVQHGLDLDRSPSTPTLGGEPALVYNSATVSVKPLVDAIYSSDSGAGLPTLLEARLNWNSGGYGGWVSFSTSGHSAGDIYDLAVQVSSAVTSTSYYPYSIQVRATYVSETVTRTATGNVAVVAQGSDDAFGQGWSLAGLDYLVSTGSGVVWVSGASGTARFFSGPTSGTYASPANDFGTLTVSGGIYTYTAEGHMQWTFGSDGLLTKIVDTHGLTRTFTYDTGRIYTIEDPDGSTATFGYDVSNKLSEIDAPGARTVAATVSGGDLTALVNPDGGERDFGYSSHKLTSDDFAPLGMVSYDYKANGTIGTVTLDGSSTLTVDAAAAQGLASPALNASAVKGVLTYPLGQVHTYTLDTQGRTTQLEQPAGAAGVATETWTLNGAGLPTAYTDALGNETDYAYNTGYSSPATVTYADSTHVTAVYESTYHQPTSVTDQRGNVTGFQYNGSGDLIAFIDGLGNRTSFLVNDDGQTTAMIDALNRRTSFLFDDTAQVYEVTDPLLGITTTLYDDDGNATGVINALGHETDMTYDAMRRLTSVTRPGSLTALTQYDYVGNVTAQIDELGRITQFGYDGQGRLTTTTAIPGGEDETTTSQYHDVAGNVTGMRDANGMLTHFYLDSGNRVTETVDPQGNASYASYDKNDNVVSTQDGNGNTAYSYFDALNRVTQTVDGAGNASYTTYDDNGNVASSEDGNGNVTQYLRDGNDLVTETIDGNGNPSYVFYDKVGNATGLQNANGHLTQQLFDANNRLTETIDLVEISSATFTVTTFEFYDAAGNVTGVKDGNDHLTQFVFDDDGRQAETIDALSQSSYQFYDAADNVTGSQDVNGHLTQYLPDAHNRVTETIDALNHASYRFYDGAGNVTGVRNANGHLTQYLLNDNGQVTETIDLVDYYSATNTLSSMSIESYTYYDAAGNVSGSKDANGHLVKYLLDGNNRVTETIYFEGTVGGDPVTYATQTSFDPAGNVNSVTDANGHTTGYSYDGDNRRIGVTNALGVTTASLLDAVGNVTEIVDITGTGTDLVSYNPTTFTYDELNRKINETDSRGYTVTFMHDSAGLLTEMIDRLGRKRLYQYDDLNRVTTELWYTSTGTLTDTITTGYDAVGNVTHKANITYSYDLYYDEVDRVTGVSEPFGLALTFVYDDVGNRTGVQDNQGFVETSIYDGLDRLITRELNLPGLGGGGGDGPDLIGLDSLLTVSVGTALRIDLVYLPAGQISTEQRYSDLDDSTFVGGSHYLYDEIGNVTSIVHQDGGGSPLVTLLYEYDPANQLQSQERIEGAYDHTDDYSHDDANQVTSDGTSSYTFDETGNRTGDDYSTDTGNLLSSDANWEYTYDAEGNLTHKQAHHPDPEAPPADYWDYTYDTANRLVQADFHSYGHSTLHMYYSYDPFGNRLQKNVAGDVERYGIDAWDPEGQGQAEVWADLDGDSVLKTRYVHGDDVDQLFARVGVTPGEGESPPTYAPAWLLTDRLGSVVDVTNSEGTALASATYDGWGNASFAPNQDTFGHYGWTGRQDDAETGLQYNRQRYYDPKTGRWMTQDPLGFDAGDSNLYRYVNNDVTNGTDPSG